MATLKKPPTSRLISWTPWDLAAQWIESLRTTLAQ